jgi:hypothetical protein
MDDPSQRLTYNAAVALAQGRRLTDGPRAASVHYDRSQDMLVIALTTDMEVRISPRLLQGFADATPEQLEMIKASDGGLGIRNEALDADLYVPNLLQGIYGTRKWMEQLDRRTTARSLPA